MRIKSEGIDLASTAFRMHVASRRSDRSICPSRVEIRLKSRTAAVKCAGLGQVALAAYTPLRHVRVRYEWSSSAWACADAAVMLDGSLSPLFGTVYKW